MSGTDEYPGMLFPLAQADNALRLSGLKDDDLFRVELRQAITAIAELIAAADMAEKRLPWADPEARRLRAAIAAVTAQGAGSVTGQHKSNPEQSEDCRGGEVSGESE